MWVLGGPSELDLAWVAVALFAEPAVRSPGVLPRGHCRPTDAHTVMGAGSVVGRQRDVAARAGPVAVPVIQDRRRRRQPLRLDGFPAVQPQHSSRVPGRKRYNVAGSDRSDLAAQMIVLTPPPRVAAVPATHGLGSRGRDPG